MEVYRQGDSSAFVKPGISFPTAIVGPSVLVSSSESLMLSAVCNPRRRRTGMVNIRKEVDR